MTAPKLPRKRRWTPERISAVRAPLAEGRTFSECAAILGASVQALKQALAVFRRNSEADLGELPVSPRALAPWPAWAVFNVSAETRAALKKLM